MRLLLAIVLIMVLAFAATWLFPWWAIAVVCFGVPLLFRFGAAKAFLSGFAGIFLLWLLTGFFKDQANAHILSSRMAAMFQLPGSYVFLLVAAFVGALVGGFAGWSGAAVRSYYTRQR